MKMINQYLNLGSFVVEIYIEIREFQLLNHLEYFLQSHGIPYTIYPSDYINLEEVTIKKENK